MSLTYVSDNGSSWAFDGSDGIQLVHEVDGLTTVPTDLVLEQRVVGDGASLANSRRSPRRITLSFMFTESPSVTLTKWGTLMSALSAGGSIVFDGPNGVRTLRQCLLESATYDRSGPGQRGTDDEYTVSILALDPWWYGPPNVVTISPLGTPTGWDEAISWDADLPWDGGSTVTLTIQGDAPAFPRIAAKDALGTLTVSNGEQGFELAAAQVDGQVVSVDTRYGHRGPFRGADLIGGFDPSPVDWSLLTESSRLFTLPVGSTTVIYGATGTSGTSSITIGWENRWLTP